MPFIQTSFAAAGGSQDNHVRLLRALADQVTGIHVTAVAIASGGTGYTVGDVLTLSGTGSGTARASGGPTFNARLIVTSVNSGVVDGISIESAGAYATAPDPTSAGISVTGGTGSGATLTVEVSGPYTAVPDTAGSGYAVGDLVSIDGFTGAADPQFRVTAVSSGAVTELAQHTLGDFEFDEAPLATSATTADTGSGDDALTVDVSKIGWQTQRRDDADDETDFEWIARGTNLSGSDPFVGIFTFTTGGSPQWNLAGMTGFNDSLTFPQQPGISPQAPAQPPGQFDESCRIPLTADGTFELFVSVTGRRFVAILRQTPVYEMLYCGLFSPFIDDPENKWPLPLLVSGTTHRENENFNTAFAATTTPHAALPHHGGGSNAYMYRWIDGTWRRFGISSSAAGNDNYLWPYRADPEDIDNPATSPINPSASTFSVANQMASKGAGFAHDENTLISTGGQDGFAPLPFGVGGQTHPVTPYIIINDEEGSGISQIIGELEGVLHINGEGLSAEDRVSLTDGRIAGVYPNINSSANNRFYAVVEN